VQQTGFALGAALAGMVANAAGLSSGLGRTDMAGAAFWVPTTFTFAALLAIVAGLRLARVGLPSLSGVGKAEAPAKRAKGS
jgi:hypothetical protein